MIILLNEEKEYSIKGCCGLWYLPTDSLCEHYTADTGPGILMKDCTNCLFFEDRKLKYKRLYDE